VFKYALLALLAQQPRHGYELKVVFDKTMSSLWPPINVGQIYTTLARLERDGLVKEQPSAPDARHDKRVYELTAAGQAALREWLAESNDNAPVKNQLIVKLVFAQLSGMADLRALLARQRRQYLQALHALDELAANPPDTDGADPRLLGLLVAGASLHLQADLKWLDLCEEQLPRTKKTGPA
jgi:DNA-binding PadR family transcriptional regulator